MTSPHATHARALRAAITFLAAATLIAAPVAGAQTERVVCVSKQINEFMYAIGAQGVIVGRDLTSVYPAAITRITSVGYHRALNAEGIVSLRPTVFLTDGNFGPDEVAQQINKVGIPILTIKPGNSLDGAESLLTQLGQRFHREKAADSIVSAMKSQIAAALKDTLKWQNGKRPRVLMMHFGEIANNYLGLRKGSIGDQMLRWAGGENALDSIGGMQRLTPEAIAKAAPDIIIATEVGFDRLGSAEKFAAMPGVDLTPAGKAHRIYRLEEDYLMYYGPRTAEGVRRIEGLLHPQSGKH